MRLFNYKPMIYIYIYILIFCSKNFTIFYIYRIFFFNFQYISFLDIFVFVSILSSKNIDTYRYLSPIFPPLVATHIANAAYYLEWEVANHIATVPMHHLHHRNCNPCCKRCASASDISEVAIRVANIVIGWIFQFSRPWLVLSSF